MPRASATCVLQCAGNGRGLYKPVVAGVQWKYGAVGNARWTGVRVRDLLDRAGLKGTAHFVHTSGPDKPPGKVPPFLRSVEIEKLLQDGIVAYEMNGEPLVPLHGAPARLVVPGWAGDHWMKWLTRLSAQPEPQKGFYMEVAYRYPKQPGAPGVAFKPDEMTPVTDLFVKSNITEAPAQARVGSPITIRGFAFSGAPDIAKVEVSDDGGGSWTPAALDSQHDPYAWRLWSFRYQPKTAGKVTLVARATDSRGSVQPKEAVWNQSGYLYNGWHAADVEVTA
jgi:sulfite oxidase